MSDDDKPSKWANYEPTPIKTKKKNELTEDEKKEKIKKQVEKTGKQMGVGLIDVGKSIANAVKKNEDGTINVKDIAKKADS